MANSEHFANYLINYINFNMPQNKINRKSIMLKIGTSNFDILIEGHILNKVEDLEFINNEYTMPNLLKSLGR